MVGIFGSNASNNVLSPLAAFFGVVTDKDFDIATRASRLWKC
jgi:hypothetical protein